MPNAEDVLLSEVRGGIAFLTMNRPRVLNVLNEELADALASAVQRAAEDASVRAVVLSGAGRSFMAGGDLTRFHADLPNAPRTAARLIDQFHATTIAIASMPKPVIAAIQGPVAGGGVALALACDFVIAARDATMLSAYTRLGTSPDGGTTWTVTRLLGPRRAMEFMLLNEPLDADATLRLGLVNRVVARDELLLTATALAERLSEAAPHATAAVKKLVQQALMGTLSHQLSLERMNFVTLAGTPDFREGITAFVERRPPSFSA